MNKPTVALLSWLLLFLGVSCSEEDIINKDDVQTSHREATPYMRALAKLPRVNKSLGRYGTRTTDGVAGVIPLCYGDTASPGGNTGYVDPSVWEPPQTASMRTFSTTQTIRATL